MFNLVLDSGIFPEKWLIGIIKPIYKNKGDEDNPANYRPITLLSCVSKLFTSVLNNRLNQYVERTGILLDNQAGFRKGFSTTDHIFTLHTLIEILKNSKQKVFCAFIDFSKAFDNVWRTALWRKLLKYDINGKIFNVIKSMYSGIKSCVEHNNSYSDFFYCKNGVRQGENLSPLIFALYMNDLEHFLSSSNINGVSFTLDDNDLYIFIRMLVLLYADDTVLLSDCALDLQKSLHSFNMYCELNKLSVNFEKTKILVFGSRTCKHNFVLGNRNVETVNHYKYLGVLFSSNRSYAMARKTIVTQANKAMHLLYKRIRNIDMSIDCKLYLFDCTILPILLDGCEIWGYENVNAIEKVHTDF